MKKIIVLIVFITLNIFASDKVKFYKPSFNCEKVKQGSIEYKICTNEKLAQLDKELSKYYSVVRDISTSKKIIKKEQRKWIKIRNKCKHNSCLKDVYMNRIEQLQNNFVKNIQLAHKKALAEEDINKAVSLLKHAGIKQIVKKKPKGIDFNEYTELLSDYSELLYKTSNYDSNITVPLKPVYRFNEGNFIGNERYMPIRLMPNSTERLFNLCDAQNILEKLIVVQPEKADNYLVLGNLYLRLHTYILKAGYQTGIFDYEYIRQLKQKSSCTKEVWLSSTLPFKAKDRFKDYQTLLTEQNQEINLPAYIDDYLTKNYLFNVEVDLNPIYSWNDETSKSVCKDYGEALQMLPENEIEHVDLLHRKLVRRGDITKYSSKFKKIAFKTLPRDVLNYLKTFHRYKNSLHESVNVFEYKGKIYFDDSEGMNTLFELIGNYPKNNNKYTFSQYMEKCHYELLDFKKEIIK